MRERCFAASFDVDRLTVTGPSVPVLEDIIASPGVTGGAQVAVSGNGTLVYLPDGRRLVFTSQRTGGMFI